MRRQWPIIALVILGAAAPSCVGPPPQISWIQLETPRASPRVARVRLYFTRRAVPYEHVVVARYQVRTRGDDLHRAMDALVRRAAADGSDAVILERGVGAAVTVWSWLLLLIPVKEHPIVLHAFGVRYRLEGGDPCARS